VTTTPKRKPSGWIWLLVVLPPGGFGLWGDWLDAHAPRWLNLLVILFGLPALVWLTYRLQWPNGYRNRRRDVPKHQSGIGT